MNKKYLGVIVAATAIFGSLGGVVLTASEAQAGCGWLDPTCNSGPGDCLFGACPKPSGSKVPSDQTPPRVRTARTWLRQGYNCIEVREFPQVTCRTPSGMSSSEFRVQAESYHGKYLGSSRQWAWNCLNQSGQVWGNAAQMQCIPGMR
jgi:hypothetical protein